MSFSRETGFNMAKSAQT